ncbi:hypothetical protein [Desulfovibrio sp. ZJ200]|uniref:hypothetical protein n=1 Tax=Desulfovibrio sp. ZJ200 TaxID=2709792 RepID=UPI00197E533F|nr:hypothetical protein [Desulfovibrio sp. ZJ200]
MFREKGALQRFDTEKLDIDSLPDSIKSVITSIEDINAEKEVVKNKLFIDIITLMRHSLAHSDFKFTINKETDTVNGINFTLRNKKHHLNDNIYKKYNNLPEKIHMSEDELVSLLERLVQLFEDCTDTTYDAEISETFRDNEENTTLLI